MGRINSFGMIHFIIMKLNMYRYGGGISHLNVKTESTYGANGTKYCSGNN